MNISPDDERFQLGRRLYEAQVLHADVKKVRQAGGILAESWMPITPERVMEVCERYCELINVVGFLRADYSDCRKAMSDLLAELAAITARVSLRPQEERMP